MLTSTSASEITWLRSYCKRPVQSDTFRDLHHPGDADPQLPLAAITVRTGALLAMLANQELIVQTKGAMFGGGPHWHHTLRLERKVSSLPQECQCILRTLNRIMARLSHRSLHLSSIRIPIRISTSTSTSTSSMFNLCHKRARHFQWKACHRL